VIVATLDMYGATSGDAATLTPNKGFGVTVESKSTPASLPKSDEHESGNVPNSLLHRLRPRVGTVLENVFSAAILAAAAIMFTLYRDWQDEKRYGDWAQAELVRRLDHFAFAGNGLDFGQKRLTALLDAGFEYRQNVGCHSFPQLVSTLRDDTERLTQQEAVHLFSLYGLAKSADARAGDPKPAPKFREGLRRAFAEQFAAGVSAGASFVDWSRHEADFQEVGFRPLTGQWYPRDDCRIQ
jgi:hypothetical protein